MSNAHTPLPAPVSDARAFLRARTAVLLVFVGVAGCRDAPTDPMVGLVAEDTYAAMALGVSFPDPAVWAGEHALHGEGARALERWQRSWDLPADAGRSERTVVYAALAEGLADVLTVEELGVEVAVLDDAVLRAGSVAGSTLPAHLALGIERAVEAAKDAREAYGAGDRVRTLVHLMEGGDALREVGPEAVARALQVEVEDRLRRVLAPHPYSGEDLERVRRLVQGGRQAVEAGDWGLAIRRAFYARGLLDGNG